MRKVCTEMLTLKRGFQPSSCAALACLHVEGLHTHYRQAKTPSSWSTLTDKLLSNLMYLSDFHAGSILVEDINSCEDVPSPVWTW